MLHRVIDIVKSVGSFIREEATHFSKNSVEFKGGYSDLVSYVDKEAERRLVEGLGALDLNYGFIAEEGTGTKSNEWNWIIDPLDGTTNFIHGLPIFSVSVALVHRDELQLGVVYDIMNDECYSAEKGRGAYCNGRKIHVSESTELKQTLLATGFPYYKFDQLPGYLEILEQLMMNTRGLRRMGSAAIDLAYTASGKFDAFFEYNLKPWDVAAGLLLVKEAGGIVSDFAGGNDTLSGKEVIAGNLEIHQKVLDIIQSKWK